MLIVAQFAVREKPLAAGAGEVVTKWSDLVYMQDMTPQACADGTISTNSTGDTYQKQLIDIRDGKKYWVAKLNDGLCWMTQNLSLDLNNIMLTSSDSDVTTDWSPNITSTLWNNTDNNTIQWYNPGNRYCPSGNCTSTNSTSSNNGHDAQGNYYTFNAATAGTGEAQTNNNQNATSSICPKGWKLPLSGSSNGLSASSTLGSFGKMVNSQLNITSAGTADTNLLKSPLHFVRGGYITSGSLTSAGSYGRYWSSTSGSVASAYYLFFNNSGINPSANLNRYDGSSIRCVAR